MDNNLILVNGILVPPPRYLRLTRGVRNPSRPRDPNQNQSPSLAELYPNRTKRHSSGYRHPTTQAPASPNNRILRTPRIR